MAKGKYAAETAAVAQRMKDGARLSFNTYTYAQPETYDAFLTGGIRVSVYVARSLAKHGIIKRVKSELVGHTLVETYEYAQEQRLS
jgi:hypothetical protein